MVRKLKLSNHLSFFCLLGCICCIKASAKLKASAKNFKFLRNKYYGLFNGKLISNSSSEFSLEVQAWRPTTKRSTWRKWSPIQDLFQEIWIMTLLCWRPEPSLWYPELLHQSNWSVDKETYWSTSMLNWLDGCDRIWEFHQMTLKWLCIKLCPNWYVDQLGGITHRQECCVQWETTKGLPGAVLIQALLWSKAVFCLAYFHGVPVTAE